MSARGSRLTLTVGVGLLSAGGCSAAMKEGPGSAGAPPRWTRSLNESSSAGGGEVGPLEVSRAAPCASDGDVEADRWEGEEDERRFVLSARTSTLGGCSISINTPPAPGLPLAPAVARGELIGCIMSASERGDNGGGGGELFPLPPVVFTLKTAVESLSTRAINKSIMPYLDKEK